MEYNIKGDLENAAKSAEDAKAIYDNAIAEKREMTDDENSQFETLMSDHQKFENKAEKQRSINKALALSEERLSEIAESRSLSTDNLKEEKEESKRAFRSYMANGLAGMNSKDKEILSRAQASSPDSAGGYSIDSSIASTIVETMKSFGGVRSVASVESTATGGDWNFVKNDETGATGEWIAENATATELDTVFGNVTLGAHIGSSKFIYIPRSLLQDSEFDLERYLVKILSTRLSRLTNTAYTAGDGSAKPTGIVNESSLGVAAAGITSTTFNEFLDLKHSVDVAYRNGASWMFNDKTLLVLKKLAITSANQSLWQPGVVGGAPSTIDGDPYTVNNDMADVAAGTRPVIYGDMSKYMIRDVKNIDILRGEELRMKFNQITFLGFLRTDGKLLDNAAIKHMRMSNS